MFQQAAISVNVEGTVNKMFYLVTLLYYQLDNEAYRKMASTMEVINRNDEIIL